MKEHPPEAYDVLGSAWFDGGVEPKLLSEDERGWAEYWAREGCLRLAPGPFNAYRYTRTALGRLALKHRPKPTKSGEQPTRKPRAKGTVNQRMLAMLRDDPTLMEWSAAKWAEKLGVTATAVKLTPAWTETIRTARAMMAAERAERDARGR